MGGMTPRRMLSAKKALAGGVLLTGAATLVLVFGPTLLFGNGLRGVMFWAGVVLLGGFYLAFSVLFGVWMLVDGVQGQSAAKALKVFRLHPGPPARLMLDPSDPKLRDRLRSEVIFGVCQMPLGLIFGRVVSFVAGSGGVVPAWALIVLPLVVVRGLMLQARLMGKPLLKLLEADISEVMRWQGLPTFPLLSGVSTMLVGFQHGLVLASAMMKDATVHERFLAGWSSGAAAGMLPVISALGLSGMMVCAWFVASLWQVGAAMGIDSVFLHARLVGFSALARELDREARHTAYEKSGTTAIFTIAKLLGETVTYLFVGTSVAMARGVTLSTDPTVGLPVLIVAGTAIWQAFGFARDCSRAWTQLDDLSRGVACSATAVVLCMTMFLVVRVLMQEFCASHQWGVSTGCIPL